MTVRISGKLPGGEEARYDGTDVIADSWMLDDTVVLVIRCDVDAIEQKSDGQIIRKLKPTHVEAGDDTVHMSLDRLYDQRVGGGSLFPEGVSTMSATSSGGTVILDANDPEGAGER